MPGVRSTLFAPNPAVEFGAGVQTYDTYAPDDVTVEPVWNTDSVLLRGHAATCTGAGAGDAAGVFMGIGSGSGSGAPPPVFYRFDRRMSWIDNTPGAPTDVGSGERAAARDGVCPAVPRTPLNEGSCVRRAGDRCGRPVWGAEAVVTLDPLTLRAWFTQSAKHVYTVRGLRFETGRSSRYPPCAYGQPSR